MSALVTVIIPTYNSARYLGEAIESVLSQSYRPIEIIVVDDGSTDDSSSVVKSFGTSLIRYHHQSNQGTAAARNKGLELARGHVIAHLDADDLWEKNKLTLQMNAIQVADHYHSNEPRPDIISGHVNEFYSPDLPSSHRERLRPPRQTVPGHVVSAMLVSREIHERVGPWDTSLSVGQDLDWIQRAQEMGIRTRMLPDVVLYRRLHASNKGLVHSDAIAQKLRILKASIERRRARGSGVQYFNLGGQQPRRTKSPPYR